MNAGRIFGPGVAGSWDDAKVSCPVVLVEDGRYRMWYYGRDREFPGNPGPGSPFGRTGLAESADGLHWERVPGPGYRGSVLDPSEDPDRFDSAFLGGSSIVRTDHGYRLYYLGARRQPLGERGSDLDVVISIGLAESPDGLRFRKIDGEAGRGAVLSPAMPGGWGEHSTNLPRVLRLSDGSWRMYYHGADEPGRAAIGVAESGDGVIWEKRGKVFEPSGDPTRFDARSVSTRHVIPWQGGWLMAYEALPAEPGVAFSIGLATSLDGLRWERLHGRGERGAAVARGEAGSWDEMAIGTPYLLAMPDNSLRLYYVGFSGQIETAIGLALCDGQDLTRWDKYETA
ncbi:MAG: hypothetical protein KatS3mg060_3629 [Dehalococcoidia bacterium]|nr:MAG: hypothetical protein KatS3mg060_3629 [Dehalococcoidia bacterium]